MPETIINAKTALFELVTFCLQTNNHSWANNDPDLWRHMVVTSLQWVKGE